MQVDGNTIYQVHSLLRKEVIVRSHLTCTIIGNTGCAFSTTLLPISLSFCDNYVYLLSCHFLVWSSNSISFHNNWSFRARATSSSGDHQPIQPDVLGQRGRFTAGRLRRRRRWRRPRLDIDFGPAHCYSTLTWLLAVFKLNCLLFRSYYFIQIHFTLS